MVPEGPDAELPFTRSPSQYGPYEAYQWSLPPRDFGKWQELMFQLARHCVERFGAEEVGTWYWELWNEPDIAYWRGTVAQYCDLYDHTVEGLTRALPSIKVGGPAVTGGERAVTFMEAFLAHCDARGTRLDFITFHTKGSSPPPPPRRDIWTPRLEPGDTQARTQGDPEVPELIAAVDRLVPGRAHRLLELQLAHVPAEMILGHMLQEIRPPVYPALAPPAGHERPLNPRGQVAAPRGITLCLPCTLASTLPI